MPTLLLRHGESGWNAAGRFTGWVDVDLTALGQRRAHHAGDLLREAGLVPTVLHTSLLMRALRTGDITVRAAGCPDIPVHRTWRLNERSYGALEGRVRADVRAEVGGATYRSWRRSCDGSPPSSSDDAHARLLADPRYADLDPADVPRTESLSDVVARLLPHWDDVLVPQLRAGHTPLVVGHSNSLRGPALAPGPAGTQRGPDAGCPDRNAAPAPVGRGPATPGARRPVPGAGGRARGRRRRWPPRGASPRTSRAETSNRTSRRAVPVWYT